MKELHEIEAGDTVFIKSMGEINHTATVARVTTTQIVVGGDKYSRKTGYRYGDHTRWRRTHIIFATAEEIAVQQAKVEHANAVYNIRKLCDKEALRKMPIEKLNRLLTLLKEEKI